MPTTVADVLHALEEIAPAHLALEDDPIGLLIGDPVRAVERVVVALDVTPAVAEAAAARGAGLIVAHHPLIYHPARTLRADEPFPGGVALACARAEIAVAAAHTNWDVAPGGINDILAARLGLSETRPLRITHRERMVKVTVFVPADNREAVLDAMAGAGGGGIIGNYDRCAFSAPGTGTFRPLPGAQPFIGTIGQPETVAEERLEMLVPEERWPAVVAAMRAAHPYEEVAYDIYPLANGGTEQGIGRIGTLPEHISAAAFRETVKQALDFPEVRMAGPAERPVRTVAVCGGAGAFLMPDALAAGADAFVTADIRHHEYVDAEARGLPLLDAGHAATESPGTEELARRLAWSLAAEEVEVTYLLSNGYEGASIHTTTR